MTCIIKTAGAVSTALYHVAMETAKQPSKCPWQRRVRRRLWTAVQRLAFQSQCCCCDCREGRSAGFREPVNKHKLKGVSAPGRDGDLVMGDFLDGYSF